MAYMTSLNKKALRNFLIHLLKHILPAYYCSLFCGSLFFLGGYNLSPPTSLDIKNLDDLVDSFSAIFLIAGECVTLLAILAITCSEIFRWQNFWIYFGVAIGVTLISFAVLVIRLHGPPWVMFLPLMPDDLPPLEYLKGVSPYIWAVIATTSAISGTVYWLIAGRHAGKWQEAPT